MFVSCDEELVEKIYNVCRACHSTKKGYNTIDRVCSAVVPFYHPADKRNVFDVECLHSAQAIILILRECIGHDHPVMCRIYGLNSRSHTPEMLRDVLVGLGSPHDLCVVKPFGNRLLKHGVNDMH